MVCPSTSLRMNPSCAQPVYFRRYLSNLIVVMVKNDQTGIVPTSNSSDTLWKINWNRAPGSHKYLGPNLPAKLEQLFDLARLGRIPDCKIAPMQRIPAVRSDAGEASDSRDGSSRSCCLRGIIPQHCVFGVCGRVLLLLSPSLRFQSAEIVCTTKRRIMRPLLQLLLKGSWITGVYFLSLNVSFWTKYPS